MLRQLSNNLIIYFKIKFIHILVYILNINLNELYSQANIAIVCSLMFITIYNILSLTALKHNGYHKNKVSIT